MCLVSKKDRVRPRKHYCKVFMGELAEKGKTRRADETRPKTRVGLKGYAGLVHKNESPCGKNGQVLVRAFPLNAGYQLIGGSSQAERRIKENLMCGKFSENEPWQHPARVKKTGLKKKKCVKTNSWT